TARVTARPSVGSWFGAAAPRTLYVSIENRGSLVVDGLLVRAEVGRDTSIDAGPLDAVGPGETRVVELPFDLEVLTHGDVTIRGSVTAASASTTFETSASTRPWG